MLNYTSYNLKIEYLSNNFHKYSKLLLIYPHKKASLFHKTSSLVLLLVKLDYMLNRVVETLIVAFGKFYKVNHNLLNFYLEIFT